MDIGTLHTPLPCYHEATLAANLCVLAARFPALAHEVEAAETPPLELAWSRQGEPSARLGGRALHSAYDPRAEASRLVASLSPAVDTAVLLGFGLGYLAEACRARGGPERLVVCEADAGMLRAALSLRDLRPLLADDRLGFVVGGEPEGLLVALELSGARRLAVLPLVAEEAAQPGWYARARAAADRFAAKERINENTLRRFGRLWVDNLAKNLAWIAKLPGVATLADRLSGLPALVLAAGPSLDALLPHLDRLRERCILVAVDTALRSILVHGVEPDFLVVVDPQYWNWRHLEGLAAPSSILVTESAAWPAVFRFPCRAAFLGGSLFPLGRAIEEVVGPKGTLGAGGSVATSAWDLCRILGAGRIYMAGLDLGFPGGATHARASLFEQRALAAGSRLRPAENALAAALFGADPTMVPDNSGGLIRSDKRMALYAWWFESRLARAESPPTWSLALRGRAIPGMPYAALDELLSLPPCRKEIERRLLKVVEDGTTTAQGAAEATARLAEGRRALLAAIAAVEEAARTGLAAAEEALTQLGHGGDPRPALDRLNHADALVLGSNARDVVGFLLPPLEELLGRRAESLAESLEHSRAIYRSVVDSVHYHRAALHRAALERESLSDDACAG